MAQLRAERTRSSIVETAARAFAEFGYDGISLNELVEATGMSKGAFYFHFSSKEEVALAAFRAKQKQMVGLLSAGEPRPTATDQLAWSLRRRAQLFVEDPSLRCVIRLGTDLGARSGPGSEFSSFIELAVAAWVNLLRRGIASGEFRRDLDPEATALAIFSWVVGMDSLSLLQSDAKDLAVRTEDMIDLLVPALSVSAPPKRSKVGAKRGGL